MVVSHRRSQSMDLVDFILNIAGLLLWLNWIATSVEPVKGIPNTLLGTLRRAEPSSLRRWQLLLALPLLLVLRGLLYWELGSAVQWMPSLPLGSLAITFRSDLFQRSLVYSFLSFGGALAVFYLWLLLLSMLNTRPPTPDPIGRFVRLVLGPLARLPFWAKLLLPFLGSILLWLPFSLFFDWLGVLPTPESFLHRIEQALLVALGGCLTWRYLLAAILVAHLVCSYVHLGDHPLWAYLNRLARTLLRPLNALPLQLGKVDLAPLVVLAAVFLAARLGDNLLLWLHGRLPL